MKGFAPQAFPRETLDEIKGRFYTYFERKKRGKLSIRDASEMISHVAGPAPGLPDVRAIDYSRPRVDGGGKTRPTDEEIERLMKKYEADEPHEWDVVFDELMHRHEQNSEVEKLILLKFRDGCGWYVICGDLFISKSKYYELLDGILGQAGVIALKKGVLKPWKC